MERLWKYSLEEEFRLIDEIIQSQLLKEKSQKFEKLIKPYYNDLFAVAFSILKNQNDAKEALQEALISAYLNLHKFKKNSSIKTWLYKIVRNKSIDHQKRLLKKSQSLDSDIFFELITKEDIEKYTFEQEQKELLESLNKMIEKLDDEEKELIMMRYYNDMSYEEISEVKKIKLGTVKSRLHHVKEKLKKMIQKQKDYFLLKIIMLLVL
ncbi:MAG: sigma-70 family RNA polymerase sigma factor [Leptospiraceae bacterium]|nr:sigma-70 family RNA polymerase sigma factor [Leptospiraceae bacterium]MDW7975324.1 sigma-70 family RNA polymerase sigma factor [Leptospiraceae bacterium]